MLREHARQERLAKEVQARADREDSKENAGPTLGLKNQQPPTFCKQQPFLEQHQNEQGHGLAIVGKLTVDPGHLAQQEPLQHEVVDSDGNLHRLGAAVLAFTSWD